ncbi:MAG: protein kinase domain-containing protein [Bacteroidales bacterium]
MLDRRCGDDGALRTEVQALLREQDRAEGLLDVPAWEAAAAAFVDDDVRETTAHLVTGRHLGPFVVEGRAGAGGMGEVYRARDTRLDRTVAIKVLPPETAGDVESRARLQLEARAVSALAHPNICPLFDIRCDDGVDYLVMEYLTGRTLAERMEPSATAEGERRPLPIDEAISYGAQIADALAAAHRGGIVHCDLKPSNIMLTKEGVKLLDFGVSRIRRAPLVQASAGFGEPLSEVALLGTINYMAPEQFAGKEPDARTDLFAFGALLVEMLTGRRAFDGANSAAVVRAILDDPPPRVSERQPAAPPALDDLVRRCLLKDPDERWDSARLAADELRAIADTLTKADTVPTAADVPAAVVARAGPRRGWWPVAINSALAGFALFFALAWWNGREAVIPPSMWRVPVDLGPLYRLHPRFGFALISPDGSRILFRSRRADGNAALFTKRFDQSEPVPLEGTGDAMYPFFSPDGRWIAFFSGRALSKVSVDGGPVITICETPQVTARGGSWGDDGTIVVALSSGGGLSKVPSSGGFATVLTRLDPARHDVTHRWPQMLPGSRGVLFTAHTIASRYDDASIEVVSLETGERKTLVQRGFYGRYVSSGHLVFVRHNTLYAAPMDLKRLELTGPPVAVLNDVIADAEIGRLEFSVAETGAAMCLNGTWQPLQLALAWRDASGRAEPLAVVPGGYADPRVSPRSGRIALTVGEGSLSRRQIAILEPGRREPVQLASEAVDLSPLWAPDGQHVVFGSDRHGGLHNLYWRRADGAGPVVRLTWSNHIQAACSFSPDGRRLAYVDLDPLTRSGAWTIPLDLHDPDRPVPGQPEPLFQPSLEEGNVAFSPDGRWLAYDGTEGGTTEVFVRPAVAGTKTRWQVSRGGGAKPLWSKGGQELIYQMPQRGIARVRFAVEGERFVVDEPRPWPGVEIAVYDGSYTMRNFDLSADGRRLLVLDQPEPPIATPRSSVTLLLNFLDELRRRAPVR